MKTKKYKKWAPNRQNIIKQEFYDRRFRNKVVKDKKKQLNKRICRIKIKENG